tara:strand:- start:530 stop:1339 length:810 start_codon:yes stop_codon:yes gene_type:complete
MLLSPDFTRQFFVFLFFIILLIIIILLLYYNLTQKIFNITKELMNKQARNNKLVQKDIIPLFNDNEEVIITDNKLNDDLTETYILYVYFENHYGNDLWLSDFHSPKNILRREGKNVIHIQYKPDTNQLIVKVPIKRLGIHHSNRYEEELNLHNQYESIIVNGIKLQKWLQIAITINNREVNIFIDKKLRKNQLLDNVPILNNSNFILGEKYKNPNCFIGKIEYSTEVISSSELRALYLRNIRTFSISSLLRESIYFENEKIKDSIYSPS